jgi:UDP-N-acetylmuramoyl-tripeptide--D-alanyl-D-alanine ligase
VLKTEGNRNNHIGLPLTLLELRPEHAAAVVEIGLNHPGELKGLSRLAQPQVAVITNVAAAHLEGLGDVEGVARAKAEITAGLAAEGTLVTPYGVAALEAALVEYRGPRRTFGLESGADVHPQRVVSQGVEGSTVELAEGVLWSTRLLGRHAVQNLLAAATAAAALGVPLAAAGSRVSAVEAVPGRLAPRRAGDVTVLDDSYNANPASLRASLAVLAELPGSRWAVLGDMLELGPRSAEFHRDAGRAALFLDGLVTVGSLAREIGLGAIEAGLDPGRVLTARDGREAARTLAPRLRPGAVVLVKGSRGARLETAVAELLLALEEGV